jgi:aminoglycoside phosphotransferase (APT) family kinase protein
MVSELVGEPIHAVLPPPQLRRFRDLANLGEDEHLEVVVHGWHKLVLLTADRAFLFARHPIHVAGLERELSALDALTAAAVPLVPKLLGRWDDQDVHPHPFAAVSRLPGAPLDDPVVLFEQLGRAIAAWHALAPPAALRDVPPPFDAAHHLPHQQWLHRALDPKTSADAADEAVETLGAPDRRAQWAEHLAAAAQLPHVFVHGDIHEGQLLAADDRTTLTGVLDWETARIDHPFFDFDFGEWGTALWRNHRPQFAALWRAQWEPYARARGLDLPVEPLVTAFGVRQQLWEAGGATRRSSP